ncbi:cation transporter [Mycoplasmatota bacterium]|nr:cation transporter [Mycoplasmatota bacterium]
MKKKLIIEGMTCKHCVMHVKNALMEVDGVIQVDVSLEEKQAVVETNEGVSDSQLKNAVTETGYKVLEVL